MSVQHEAIADRVVKSFKALLEDDVQSSISNKNFDALKGMVCEALSEHSQIILSRLDGVIKELKADVDRPSREL